MTSDSASTPVRLVCFDLGGVLLRICRTWAEACAVAGIPLRSQPDLEASPEVFKTHAAYQVGAIDTRTFAERMSALLGDYTADEVELVHDSWVYGEYDHVQAVIASIHDAGIATAALSNTSPDHWREMPKYPAVMALGQRFASHEIAARKPDAGAYLVVESETGHRGDEILFFDDLPENIAAAQTRGWRTVHVDPHQPTAPQISGALVAHAVVPADSVRV